MGWGAVTPPKKPQTVAHGGLQDWNSEMEHRDGEAGKGLPEHHPQVITLPPNTSTGLSDPKQVTH